MHDCIACGRGSRPATGREQSHSHSSREHTSLWVLLAAATAEAACCCSTSWRAFSCCSCIVRATATAHCTPQRPRPPIRSRSVPLSRALTAQSPPEAACHRHHIPSSLTMPAPHKLMCSFREAQINTYRTIARTPNSCISCMQDPGSPCKKKLSTLKPMSMSPMQNRIQGCARSSGSAGARVLLRRAAYGSI